MRSIEECRVSNDVGIRSQTIADYSSTLSVSSPRYDRKDGGTSPFYYFEAIQVIVSTSNTYRFDSNSTIDTFAYLYNQTFDPYNPSLNLLQSDDDGAGSLQFRINISLLSDGSYVLVATTFRGNATAFFSVLAYGGPGNITFTKLNISVTTTTAGTTTTATTTSK